MKSANANLIPDQDGRVSYDDETYYEGMGTLLTGFGSNNEAANSSVYSPCTPLKGDALERMKAAHAAIKQQEAAQAAMVQQERNTTEAKQKAAMALLSKLNQGLYAENPTYQASVREQAAKDAGMSGRDTTWV